MKLKYNQLVVFPLSTVFGYPARNKNQKPAALAETKRGEIDGFSKDSIKRLRLALATEHIPQAAMVGVTLTVPWRKSFVGYLDFYRESFNRFAGAFRRHFPLSGAIFRHELQIRKMPHCHMVCFVVEEDYKNIDAFSSLVFGLWVRACPVRDGSLRSFCKYGVLSKSIDSLPAVFKYLADHASKKKQAQLGYHGKQWGYIGRKNFKPRECEIFTLDPTVLKLVTRQLSRVYRYCRKSDCVFGYKHCARRVKKKVAFTMSQTVRRVIDYYSSEFSAPLLPRLSPRLSSRLSEINPSISQRLADGSSVSPTNAASPF